MSLPARSGTARARTGPLRVAAGQAESVPGDVAANVETAVGLAERAAEAGARVLVLPELFLTGYDPGSWRPERCLAGAEDDALLPLREVSAAEHLVVVVGAALRSSDAIEDAEPGFGLCLLVFDGRGGARNAYAKQHLTAEEQPFFTAGTHGASIVVDGWELGLGICYDGCFPEHAGAAAGAGATAYLCPSAYYVGSEHRRDLYYAARALDNGIYVVFAGLAGRSGARRFNGGSAVYDPEGRAVARVGAEFPAVVVADLDPPEVRRVQAMNPVAQDRRRVRDGERRRWAVPG